MKVYISKTLTWTIVFLYVMIRYQERLVWRSRQLREHTAL